MEIINYYEKRLRLMLIAEMEEIFVNDRLWWMAVKIIDNDNIEDR